jgi:hypothetical protein
MRRARETDVRFSQREPEPSPRVQAYAPRLVRTTVTIPAATKRQAEGAAARLGLSRSGLYARAVAEYLERHRPAAITEQLDAVYRDATGRLDPRLASMQWASSPAGEW